VQRAAEVAVLERACALAEEHGALALPRWRAELKHAGRAAAQARWRSEVAAAWRRLTTGDLPESGDADGEGADPDDLRWRLAAMQRLASSTEGAS
jgi:hypothetical protein